ncbi:unnamed protein product [Euphydryas editha]|uniref:Uncharacterized protein n=1 Tax=Euphydryas editha TaxID=104508 RepID=A0AAU9UZL7_EUPED|nr:unnamed protein product [Euphydryas editha]
MSFITKRERVFNEYDLFDLPARNEGKLKAYSSCTDARAWSHFCSDKTEHLVDIIKRNNETVRPKYVPTDVIVNTLMTSKNAEIARLKRKIEEFEQLLAAYDELDLTCEQKCDIANAHAAIKAANKELDDMFLDLNLSGFTEGIDSEAFETGKSRGDETGKSRGDEWTMGKASTPRMQTKSNQIGTSCKCDASTSAHDKRIDELKETIISKDAKLSAMQNTIAVMENDVCEPYCIYAHIYTALEKIFGTLCQNEKYKQYLDLLTAGKDTRGIDLKGKIIFKMKVLEKFSLALIAPCSQSSEHQDCSCYRAEIVTHVETTFALTSAESKIPNLDIDNKRAQLVADIMQNEDMKEILSKESLSIKLENDQIDDYYISENYSIDTHNLKRLKNLQANYDELLNCYDILKHERDNLNIRCQKYLELENECECLQNKLREYNQLWKEKEFHRKRSEDLDALRESYFVLSEETANIETKLKAEQEINKIKSGTIDELRNENIKLENKLSEISLSFEKQRNILICKLKECECKMMCQEQQIKSLTNQVDSILKSDDEKILQNEDEARSMELLDEINTQKEQIKNLKDALCCNEEEKQYFQEELERKHEIINELKLEIENWKSKYENTNEYLGSYLEKCQSEINELQVNNNSAIENLNHIIESKSQEISYLIDEVDSKNFENKSLIEHVNNLQDDFKTKVTLLESEKQIILSSIHTARKNSLEILENVKNCDRHNDKGSHESLKINRLDKNENVVQEIIRNEHTDTAQANFINEIELLQEINLESVQLLQNENMQLKISFEAANREVEKLKRELMTQEDLMEKLKKLKDSHESLLNKNERLKIDLNNKTSELDNIKHAFQLSKKESETLINELHKTECIQEEYLKLNEIYQKVISDRNMIQNKFFQAETELKDLLESQKTLRADNEFLQLKVKEQLNLEEMLFDLKNNYNKLKEEKDILQNDCNNKMTEINDLNRCLKNKDDEIRDLSIKINNLEDIERLANNKIDSINSENTNMHSNINTLNEKVADMENKLIYYESLERNFNDLKHVLDKLELEKEILQKDLQIQTERITKLQQENCNLNNESKSLLKHSEDLEKALLHARDENLSHTDSLHVCYNDIKKEIEVLRQEKISYHKKIGDLLDKLEESEFRRSELDEIIVSKEKKICTLENHINELEDEIRRLQYSLNEVIETGEQIKQLSYERIEQFKTIEAHRNRYLFSS